MKAKQQRTISLWLFNPFVRLAGVNALIVGLVIMAGTALIGTLGDIHFDGVLNVHPGKDAPFWQFIFEILIDWLIFVVPLAISALIISRSSWRIIDILGTQALARWPYVIVAVIAFIMKPSLQRVNEDIEDILNNPSEALQTVQTELAIVTICGLFTLLMVIWTIVLMYRGYTISCNVKGLKAMITFIISLIIAFFISANIIRNFLPIY